MLVSGMDETTTELWCRVCWSTLRRTVSGRLVMRHMSKKLHTHGIDFQNLTTRAMIWAGNGRSGIVWSGRARYGMEFA